ncbi:MAG: sigma-70 family RNA polymerase sigma factor [Aeriscardovia sp.]|nr:sigma-70 family RNA polymerase sigma factor [Aeriscardovia sp.]
MAETRLYAKTNSDVAYVEGMYRRNPVMERALHKHCKQYFDENYRSVFFVGDEHKMEIFQESFIKLWENIEKRKIYVENGVLLGKGGKPFSSTLTTYFMGIAKLKYKEWARQHSFGTDAEEAEKLRKAKDAEIYKEMLYDEGENAMLEIISDCISHMTERCREILTLFYYHEKSLDDILMEVPTYKSKNALKTEKYKCMENLRKSAGEIYRRFVNE